MPAALGCAVFIAGLIASYVFFAKGKRYLSFGVIIAMFLILTVPVSFSVAPVIASAESAKPLVDLMVKYAGKEDPIGGENDNMRGIAFYSGRKDARDIHPYNDLIDFARSDERVWGIIKNKHYRQLKEQRTDLYLIKVGQSGKNVLFTNRPLER